MPKIDASPEGDAVVVSAGAGIGETVGETQAGAAEEAFGVVEGDETRDIAGLVAIEMLVDALELRF